MRLDNSSNPSLFSFSAVTKAVKTHSSRMATISTIGLMGLSVSHTSVAALTITEDGGTQQYNQYNQQYNQYNQQYQQQYSQYNQQYNQYQQTKPYTPPQTQQYSQYNSNNSYSNTSYQAPYSSTSSGMYGSTGGKGSSVNYFDEARRAAGKGDMSALYQFEQQMQGGLFAMYPEYWRLDSNLSSVAPATVVDFARRYPDTVMAEKLLADFAEERAGSGDYAAVRQVASYVKNADKSEACALAIGDVRGGSSMRVAEQKSKVWLNTLKQPALCDQLGVELNASSMINDNDRKARLYRMLRVGKTGEIMALSSRLGTPIKYEDLQNIQFSQNNFFNRFASEPYSEKNQYLYLYAVGKMADKSYREAAMQIDFDIRQDNQRRQRLLSEDTRKMAYRNIAVKRMNMNTDDGFNRESINWFRNSVGLPFNYEEAEDYAMAGIRFNEWDDVITAITSMDGGHQQEDTWQYWLARAYEQKGDRRKAKSLYKKVAKKTNYYGYMATDKVGKSVNLSSMGGSGLPNISSSERSKMLQNPHFARAFKLYGVNTNYAKREWNWAVQQALQNNDTALVLAAARHAHDMGWYDRSIYAMEKANESVGMLSAAVAFPMPRQSSVVQYSQRVGVDPAWAYGIMRQESRFNVGARSNVGAGGLMQIMPGTGKYIARKLGESYNSSRVNSGETNIRYGTWYMGDIMNRLGGQPVLATAGYNAGPSKAERWRPVFGSLAADQYVETIAYPETRNYVKRVMENATVYGNLLGRPQKISQRMGTVSPKY